MSFLQDLAAFSEQVTELHGQLRVSKVFTRECSKDTAFELINAFMARLSKLENEAQDLIELQELLEASIVNFSVLPQCRQDLNNLKTVWELFT